MALQNDNEELSPELARIKADTEAKSGFAEFKRKFDLEHAENEGMPPGNLKGIETRAGSAQQAGAQFASEWDFSPQEAQEALRREWGDFLVSSATWNALRRSWQA